eukprot:s2243_g2.t1
MWALGCTARAVSVPAKGVWSVLGSDEQNERLPQLALMNLHSEDMQLRLLNGCSKPVSGWAWSGRSGETLNAWRDAQRAQGVSFGVEGSGFLSGLGFRRRIS